MNKQQYLTAKFTKQEGDSLREIKQYFHIVTNQQRSGQQGLKRTKIKSHSVIVITLIQTSSHSKTGILMVKYLKA